VDSLKMETPKTRTMAAALESWGVDGSVLLLLPERDQTVERASRNLPQVKILNASYLNVRDLLSYDKILMPVDALQVVERILG